VKKKTKKPKSRKRSLSDKQITEKLREDHSRSMTSVLEEMGPLLKDIRTRLNDLSIQKVAPKVKHNKVRRKHELCVPAVEVVSLQKGFGGKAGKVVYPVLVGEITNLYKTSKSVLRTRLIVIDLHGSSRDEALENLNSDLTLWMDTAMKGDYPWVVPVDIICGGGSQLLSDVVKDWIQANRNVANRPKGFI